MQSCRRVIDKLWQEDRGANDWPGNQLRKKNNIGDQTRKADVSEAIVFPINYITDCMKDVKRNAYRQEQGRDIQMHAKGGDLVSEKIVVLENKQNPKQYTYRNRSNVLVLRPVLRSKCDRSYNKY